MAGEERIKESGQLRDRRGRGSGRKARTTQKPKDDVTSFHYKLGKPVSGPLHGPGRKTHTGEVKDSMDSFKRFDVGAAEMLMCLFVVSSISPLL